MPAKEIKIPIRLIMESRSFKLKYATTGVKRGIVEMITALMVDETKLKPKLSPKKYKKGLNKAEIAKCL